MLTTDIIKALRKRLLDAGYKMHPVGIFDPEQDRAPVVTIQVAADGIKQLSDRPRVKKSISLLVEYIFDTKTDDPLLEVLEAADVFNAALVQPNQCKRTDQLGGVAFSVELQKTIPMLYTERTDLGLVQSIIVVSYTE